MFILELKSWLIDKYEAEADKEKLCHMKQNSDID